MIRLSNTNFLRCCVEVSVSYIAHFGDGVNNIMREARMFIIFKIRLMINLKYICTVNIFKQTNYVSQIPKGFKVLYLR